MLVEGLYVHGSCYNGVQQPESFDQEHVNCVSYARKLVYFSKSSPYVTHIVEAADAEV